MLQVLDMLPVLGVLVLEVPAMLEVPEMVEVPEVVEVPGMLRGLGFAGALGQAELLHGVALDGGGRAGRPQGGQQQRRLGQVRAAAVFPVLAVGGPGGRAEFGDEGGRVGGPAAGFLAIPAVTSGRSGAGTGSSGTGTDRCWYSSASAVSPVNGGCPVRHS